MKPRRRKCLALPTNTTVVLIFTIFFQGLFIVYHFQPPLVEELENRVENIRNVQNIAVAEVSNKSTDFQTSLAAFRKEVRSNRYYYCGPHARGRWICNPAKVLGYQYNNESQRNEGDNPDVFTWFRILCPGKFHPEKIYICNRARGPWKNTLMMNKVQQTRLYDEYDEYLKDMMNRVENGELEVECAAKNLSSLYPALHDFFPITISIKTTNEKEDFLANVNKELELGNNGYWFLKKSGGGHGAGSKLLRYDEVEEFLKIPKHKKKSYIAQAFIDPWLFEGHKFQIRSWVTIYNEKPLLVTGHYGQIIWAPIPYRNPPEGKERYAIVTNSLADMPGSTLEDHLKHVRGLSQFEEYLEDEKNRVQCTDFGPTILPKDYVKNVLMKKLYDAMRWAVSATYLNSEKHITPKSGTVESSGWLNSTFVTKLCYDWVMSSDGNVWMTEENHMCRQIERLGEMPKYGLTEKDFQPKWKVDLVNSLMTQPIAIAEEIYFRKKNGLPFGFKHLTTPLLGAVPLIDHTEMTHIPTEHRVLCNERLY